MPEDKKPKRPQAGDPELSDTWRELLGLQPGAQPPGSQPERGNSEEPQGTIPAVSGDPWGQLVNDRGVEEIDLQKVRLRSPDQQQAQEDNTEVEQALRLMDDPQNPDDAR